MNRQKRIMILGGNYVQAEATKMAKKLGYYTISTDLHEDNPGHKIADEYCKVDIVDREAVLREARRLQIDGIVPFCSDILAPVAAYVQSEMHLPGNSYDVVNIMTHKHLFRDFLRQHGFLTPHSVKVTSLDEALAAWQEFEGKAMMKPTDNAGSRGVFLIENADEVKKHWQETISSSASATALLEEYIERDGLQQDGDIFVIDGKVAFWGLGDQHKRPGEPFVPAYHVFPTTKSPHLDAKAKALVQDVITALGFKQGPCNVEYIVDKHDNIWLLEIGPRNGGNLIPFLLEATTGVNLVELTVRQAVGEHVEVPEWKYKSYAMSTVLRENGKTTGMTMQTGDSPFVPILK